MKSGKKRAAPPARKKRYRTPKLTVYGDLRTLTKVKMGAMNDGAGRPMTRAMTGAPP
jgi:hypothetical protein